LQIASNVTHYSTVVSDKNSEKFHSIKKYKTSSVYDCTVEDVEHSNA